MCRSNTKDENIGVVECSSGLELRWKEVLIRSWEGMSSWYEMGWVWANEKAACFIFEASWDLFWKQADFCFEFNLWFFLWYSKWDVELWNLTNYGFLLMRTGMIFVSNARIGSGIHGIFECGVLSCVMMFCFGVYADRYVLFWDWDKVLWCVQWWSTTLCRLEVWDISKKGSYILGVYEKMGNGVKVDNFRSIFSGQKFDRSFDYILCFSTLFRCNSSCDVGVWERLGSRLWTGRMGTTCIQDGPRSSLKLIPGHF